MCVSEPIEERLDRADVAIVGRLLERKETLSLPPRTIFTFEVEQRVKGDAGGRVDVLTLSQTDCAIDVRRGQTVGLLLSRTMTGDWLATSCDVVEPGELVAAGGEPRGGAIKVVLGVVILALVLAFALYRLRRGSRPDLPGAPGP